MANHVFIHLSEFFDHLTQTDIAQCELTYKIGHYIELTMRRKKILM